jgi:hypothetical protein
MMSRKTLILGGACVGLTTTLWLQLRSNHDPGADIELVSPSSPEVVIQLERQIDLVLDGATSAQSSELHNAAFGSAGNEDPDSKPIAPPPDDAWERFPRNRVTLIALVRKAEDGEFRDVIPYLFRNEFLNEGDIRIPPSERDGLWNLINPIAQQLSALRTAQRDYLDREMPLLAAAGSLPEVARDVTPEKIEKLRRAARAQLKACMRQQAAGRDMSAQIAEFQDQIEHPERYAHNVLPMRPGTVAVQLGDTIYQAPVASIPGGQSLMQATSHLRTTFGMMCLGWFDGQGTLSPAGLRRERERLHRTFNLKESPK